MTELEVLTINPLDWRSPLVFYLENPTVSSDPDSAKIRIKVTRYTLINGVLYKKSFTLPYLRCLSPDKVEYTLKEIHEGIYGQHLGGRALDHKALR